MATGGELLQAFRGAVLAKIARDLEREAAEAGERRRRVREALGPALVEARRRELCGAAWLFGSYAWGSPGPRSDVDLLVEGCGDPDRVAALVGRATATDVHVVCAEEAPASLRERALCEGERV